MKPSFDLASIKFPRFEYPDYIAQLYRIHGIKALSKQFRYHHRRPFSRQLIHRFSPSGIGIEIGVGALTIAPLTRTLLTDGFSSHANNRTLASHFFKAHEIPFADQEFSFVLSEHVLEHLSNPIAALQEWRRILKSGGKVFLFLPHALRTFDKYRPRTSLAHLIQDYESQIPEHDETHLEEWKSEVLDRNLAPHYQSIPFQEHSALGIVHHHVWITEDMVELLTYLRFKITYSIDQAPDRLDSFLIVAEKRF